jgi:hypothetical protein
MLALASSASPGLSPTLVILIIAAITVAVFWRFLIKLGFAILAIGFAFVFITAVLDILHGLRALIP